MGLTGLTAVFGMGTGVAPPVSSPGNRPAGGHATPAASSETAVRRSRRRVPIAGPRIEVVAFILSPDARRGDDATLPGGPAHAEVRSATGRSGGVGVVKPLGC